MIPYATDPWSEIIPNLHMGGHWHTTSDHGVQPVVVAGGFDLVISLYRRWGSGPPDGVEHHYLNIPDGWLLSEDAVRCGELADIAAAAVKDGRQTLIRCQAGYNRSGLVTALTLMRLGHSADAAIGLIRAKRSPHALFNEFFVAHLRQVTA